MESSLWIKVPQQTYTSNEREIIYGRRKISEDRRPPHVNSPHNEALKMGNLSVIATERGSIAVRSIDIDLCPMIETSDVGQGAE